MRGNGDGYDAANDNGRSIATRLGRMWIAADDEKKRAFLEALEAEASATVPVPEIVAATTGVAELFDQQRQDGEALE